MFRDLSVKRRLILGFGTALAIMALMVVVTGMEMLRAEKIARTINSELNPIVSASDLLHLSVNDQRISLIGYALTGERNFSDGYNSGLADEEEAIAVLRARLDAWADRDSLAAIQSRLARIHRSASVIFEMVEAGRGEDAYRYHQDHVQPVASEILSIADGLSSTAQKRIEAALADFREASGKLVIVSRASLLTAVLLTLLLAMTTIRSITRRASGIALAVGDIARGDFGKALALDDSCGRGTAGSGEPKNELRRIARGVSTMARSLQRREHSLAAHARIGDICSSTIDLDRLADGALSELARSTESQVGALYLARDAGFEVRATFGISEENALAAITSSEGLVQQAAKSGQRVNITDIPEDTRFVVQPGLGKAIPSAISCVPLRVEGETLGVVVLGSLQGYTADAMTLIESSCVQIAIAISNALRYQEAQDFAGELQTRNELLDVQNEELTAQNEEIQAQNEEIQAQNEEVQTQNEELAAQGAELQERNSELVMVTKDLMALQSVTAVALSSLNLGELLRLLLESITSSLSLQFGLILLYDDENRVLRAAMGHNISTGDEEIWTQGIGDGFSGRVAWSREVLTVCDAQIESEILNPHIRSSGVRALIGIPLCIGERLYGVALLGASEPREFTDRERNLLQVFADRSSIAIERAQSYGRLKSAEQEARTQHERLQVIMDNMPEGIVIVTAPEGRIYTVNKAAMSLCGLEQMPDVNIYQQPAAFNLFLVNGAPVRAEDMPLYQSLIRGEACSGAEMLIRQPGGREITILYNSVPMRDDGGSIVGAVGVFQDISAIKEQQRLLQQIYEHEHSIAEALQKAFLPGVHPCVPGYEIADIYVPARHDAQVGGDFYDLIELGENRLGIVMGDVSGKGIDAALYTAMAKYMLRGFLHEDPEPARVLSRLNRAVTRYVSGEVFITLFYGILHTDDGRLVYSNGGHEQPLILNGESGRCLLLENTGAAVGVIPEAAYDSREVYISKGDAFILYTDGITEVRRGKDFFGIDGLEAVLSKNECDGAAGLANQILAGVSDYSNGSLHDDIAVLVIKSCAATAERS